MMNRRGWVVVAIWSAAFVGFALTVSHLHVTNQVAAIEGR